MPRGTYAEAEADIRRARTEAAFPGVQHRPARTGKGRACFEATVGGSCVGRAATAAEAAAVRAAWFAAQTDDAQPGAPDPAAEQPLAIPGRPFERTQSRTGPADRARRTRDPTDR
jgi:hypothetical protein